VLYVGESPCELAFSFQEDFYRNVRCPRGFNCRLMLDCRGGRNYESKAQLMAVGTAKDVRRDVVPWIADCPKSPGGCNVKCLPTVLEGAYDILTRHCSSNLAPHIIFIQLGTGNACQNPWIDMPRMLPILQDVLLQASCAWSVLPSRPNPWMAEYYVRHNWSQTAQELARSVSQRVEKITTAIEGAAESWAYGCPNIEYFDLEDDVWSVSDYKDGAHFCTLQPADKPCQTAERMAKAFGDKANEKLEELAKVVRGRALPNATKGKVFLHQWKYEPFIGWAPPIPGYEAGNVMTSDIVWKDTRGRDPIGMPMHEEEEIVPANDHNVTNGTNGTNGTNVTRPIMCDFGTDAASCQPLWYFILALAVLSIAVQGLFCLVATRKRQLHEAPSALGGDLTSGPSDLPVEVGGGARGKPRKLQGVEGARVLGAIHIMCFHLFGPSCQGPLCSALDLGRLWVQWFFVLSGFLAARASTEPTLVSFSSVIGLLRRRISALYPLYTLGAVVDPRIFELASTAKGWYFLATYLGLVQAWVPPFATDPPNGPAWFVSCLSAFWILTPAWVFVLYRVGRPTLLGVMAVCYAFSLAPLALSPLFGLDFRGGVWHGVAVHHFVAFSPVTNWHFYVAGVAAGVLSARDGIHCQSWAIFAGVFALLAGSFAVWWFVVVDPSEYLLSLDRGFWTLPFWLWLVFRLSDPASLLDRVLSRLEPAAWLAYPVYILHVPMLQHLRLLSDFCRPFGGILELLVLVAATGAIDIGTRAMLESEAPLWGFCGVAKGEDGRGGAE